jgi:hypothetical protein
MTSTTLKAQFSLQLRQQNEERIGNANSDWAPSIQHRPQAMSSPNETSHVMDSNNFLPTASEEPQLDSAVLDIIQGQRNLVSPTNVLKANCVPDHEGDSTLNVFLANIVLKKLALRFHIQEISESCRGLGISELRDSIPNSICFARKASSPDTIRTKQLRTK